MSNTSFHFPPNHAQISCLIIGLTTNTITVTITVKGQHWRLLIYVLHNFLLYNNATYFQRQPPLFLKVSQIPQEKTCVGVFFFLGMMKLNKDICSVWIKVHLHPVNMSRANNEIHWQMFFFFNQHLRRMKCPVYLTNLLLTRRSSH